MIKIDIDFEELRETVSDYIFAGAGTVAVFVEELIDRAEDFLAEYA